MVSGGVAGPGSVIGLQVPVLEEGVMDSGCGAGIAQGVVSVLVSVDIVKEIVVSELSGGAHVVDMGGEKVRTMGVQNCD